ncbi:hypothetical protein GC093_21510 [Paenibacillus sp. LMG 31456]|uniref:Uncharacterized protein n=1 Tax=Paenibacillus foliorum TaxID=2654974 RepID=A0A972GTB0_9BACL|nr:hypothetical protein [Paenibacillus foliorum]NOU95780.1 hypothetical protein [Paenibacillus foliorum]
MKETIETLIIGATFTGIGLAHRLGHQEALLVERTTLVGHEFINCYRTGTSWSRLPEHQLTRDFQQELLVRQLLTSDGKVHLGGIPPILYKLLLKAGLSEAVQFMTELIEIKKQADGYDVTLFDVSGIRTIRAHRIVDTTSDCRSAPGRFPAKAKSISAVLHHVKPAGGQLIPDVLDNRMTAGAFASEAYLQLPLPASADWTGARQTLHNVWKDRPEELKGWTIAAVADEFTVTPTSRFEELKEGWVWLPSCAYDNPLVAMDAGYAYGKGGYRHDVVPT